MAAFYINPGDGAQSEAVGFAEVKIHGILAAGEGLGADRDEGVPCIVEVEGDLVGEVHRILDCAPVKQALRFTGQGLGNDSTKTSIWSGMPSD